VLLTLGSVVLGLGIGLALRPRSTRFARPKVRVAGILVAGVLGQFLASRLQGKTAVPIAFTALCALIAFGIANLHLTGMGVMTIGLCANLLVIMVNDGMPVQPRALVAAKVASSAEVTQIELRGARHLKRPGNQLEMLTDVFPMRGQVVSLGDLIIAVATVDVIANLARRQRRRHSMSTAKPDHDWGTAPKPVASLASQYSASPDVDAPRTLVSATSAPARQSK
jgi:hypothetical protein